MTDIRDLVDGLFDKDNQLAYKCLKELVKASEQSSDVYAYFDTFAEMVSNDNSYIRSRGMLLIAENAKWDADYKIDEIIDTYLKHITDIKPITARQCMKALPSIAKHKPELKQDIIAALKKADTSIYADSMRPLVNKDIRETLMKIKGES